MRIFLHVALSGDVGFPLQLAMHGCMNRFIRHIESKPIVEPCTDALIALKAFWVLELRLQLRQRFSLNSRLLATAMPMTDGERLQTVSRLLRAPSLNGFSLNV